MDSIKIANMKIIQFGLDLIKDEENKKRKNKKLIELYKYEIDKMIKKNEDINNEEIFTTNNFNHFKLFYKFY